jgi:hypothetical protein
MHGASTRIGARPQAILHPHGNRGADLIETIRLERLSSDVCEKGVQPDTRLFVPPHHTDQMGRMRSSRPGVGGPGDRAWAEQRWTRPASAGQMRVHSAAALDEMINSSGDGDAAASGDERPSRLASPLPVGVAAGSPLAQRGETASFGSGAVSSVAARAPAARRRPHSAHTLAEMRQRQRLQQKQEQAHERVMLKLKESQQQAAAQQEEEFQRAWEQFYSEQNGAVADIEKMLRLKDVENARRVTAHAKHWNEEVFERIQDQVTRALRKREANGTYNTRWRAAQDGYLRTLAKKEKGVFRDIIIESEYDPLSDAAKNIKYSSAKVNRRDPLKLELRKHEQESRMVPGSAAANRMAKQTAAQGTLGRECFDVKQWSTVEATPYGMFNKVATRPRHEMKPSNTGERVLGNHYLSHRKQSRPVLPASMPLE